jgi:hypothetical protein
MPQDPRDLPADTLNRLAPTLQRFAEEAARNALRNAGPKNRD